MKLEEKEKIELNEFLIFCYHLLALKKECSYIGKYIEEKR